MLFGFFGTSVKESGIPLRSDAEGCRQAVGFRALITESSIEICPCQIVLRRAGQQDREAGKLRMFMLFGV